MTAANNPTTGLEFQITDIKLYVPVVTLSKENDKKLLEQLKSGFNKTVKWMLWLFGNFRINKNASKLSEHNQ